MKIGVFDSGVGGLSVANAIKKELPEYEVVYVDDKENLPYGNKKPAELLKLVLPKLNKLLEDECEVIVIACNTVSTTLAPKLREILSVPIVAIEPMLKPAVSMTKSNVITVCATPTTLASDRYKQLKQELAFSVRVIEPDCSDWSYMIENDEIDQEKIAKTVEYSCQNGSDIIVLGCTHYHWIEEMIINLTNGRAVVIQPEAAVIKQLKRVLEQPR